MALELNGTTGVSLVQDGVVTAADLSSTLDLSGKTVTLPAGTGGKVLQTRYADFNPSANQSTNSTTPSSTGLNIDITPSSASNYILVMAQHHQCWVSSTSRNGNLTFYRTVSGGSATRVETATYGLSAIWSSGVVMPLSYLDSPNTTSSVNYAVYAWIDAATGDTFHYNRDNCRSTIIAMEIAPND